MGQPATITTENRIIALQQMAQATENRIIALQQMAQATQNDITDLKKFIQIKDKLEKMEFFFNGNNKLQKDADMENPLFKKSINYIATTLSSEKNIRVRIVGYTNSNREENQTHCAKCAEFIKICIFSEGQTLAEKVDRRRLETASQYPTRQQADTIFRVVLEVESDNNLFPDDITQIKPNESITFQFDTRKFTVHQSNENLGKIKRILYHLIENPMNNLVISGYGNGSGLFQKNNAIPRAQSVRDYILSLSIKQDCQEWEMEDDLKAKNRPKDKSANCIAKVSFKPKEEAVRLDAEAKKDK